MCGIAGVLSRRLPEDEARAMVVRMVSAVAHRGPDDEGINIVSRAGAANSVGVVAFGHRRLSILDLSSAGHQPMQDSETGNWITYNGEVYNFQELRTELTQKGHRFRTGSDTEVILKAYAQWHVGCWRRLQGIFAFGLWDARLEELHLVRDQVGVKPLYYASAGNTLVFASEVRAMLASGFVERRLSPDGLTSYLRYGSVQEPCTLVEGVVSIPPGHHMIIDPRSRKTRKYWGIEECHARYDDSPRTVEGVRAALESSVSAQLVSDVPVGVFLSGGIDSAAIAAFAVRAQRSAVRTFCIGVDGAENDESYEASRTAKALGCNHSTLLLSGAHVRTKLDVALRSYDQPSCDGINSYFISYLVRSAGIKVALAGLGGDELFVGYLGFQKPLRFARAGEIICRSSSTLRSLFARATASCLPVGHSVGAGLTDLLDPASRAPYFASRSLFSRLQVGMLLNEGISAEEQGRSWALREAELAVAASGMTEVDRISFLEMQTYMLSTLLRDSDQMSMAHALELRVPLLDTRLIEYVFPMPAQLKKDGGRAKALLIDALAGVVPAEVFNRKKRGFTLPFEHWLRRDLAQTVQDCLLNPQPSVPWRPAALENVWMRFREGRIAWSRVFALFVLERWLYENRITA